MAGHRDAIGYLLDLKTDIPWDWFALACDLAIAASEPSLSGDDLKKLVSLFYGKDAYQARSATPPSSAPTAAVAPATPQPIKELTGFMNFKRLSSTLQVNFDKRITLVFGTNGSGKSSVCESLRMLASPTPPDSPLNNVYGALHSQPSFEYRFSPDTTASEWKESSGYGAFGSRIKYFDSTIALRHVTDDLRPDSVIEIDPFRLEVFDYCRSIVTKLRDTLASKVSELENSIRLDSARICTAISGIDAPHKSAITSVEALSHAELEQQINDFTPIVEADTKAHKDAVDAIARLNQASSEQGIKLLLGEASTIRRLQRSVASFLDRCREASPESFAKQALSIREKRATQKGLASDILPDGVAIENFKVFLDAANGVADLDANDGDQCPFCRRPLDGDALALVRKYHEFLISTLQTEITTLAKEIEDSASKLEEVRDFEIDIDYDTSSFLAADERTSLLDAIDTVKKSIPNPLSRNEEQTFGSFGNLQTIEQMEKRLGAEADKRDLAIQSAKSGSAERKKEVDRLSVIVQSHDYRKAFGKHLPELREILKKCKQRSILNELVSTTDFPTILRRMTLAGKEAHSELVVAEFEKSLDKEYLALSGKSLADFGIRLKPRGEQQSVAVETHIGDTPIRRVLSEGEQKVHSLALFFCEAMAQPTDIFIFDDPSTSFDYNHLGFFVERLRELVRQFPDSQFIIFTHNWDLFVQLQVVFNKARLNNDLEVKVMENCSTLAEYSEKVDDLKQQISDMLALSGDFDSGQKERISGLMRRLIEAVVNKYVFNGQRHQFKQRSQSVSVFDEFVRLVPLNSTEAQKLSDLYGHLSVSEHDDPRNIYVSRNKSSFQNWYNEIVTIESALIGRRP